MSADGKIAATTRKHVLFGSPADKAHLEKQVAEVDGILFGTGTLNAGGTAIRVTAPELIEQRDRLVKTPPAVTDCLLPNRARLTRNCAFFSNRYPAVAHHSSPCATVAPAPRF
jgi:5-amino-6-(5-phosphoribosylamino)uracil reductase